MKGESYRFKLGRFDCIVVSDGTFAYPHPAQIFFANAPKEQLIKIGDAREILKFSFELNKGKRAGLAFYH